MKFTQAISIVILAATVSAVAIPDARCGRPGQPCKREALPEPEPEARCGRPGQPCKREALAEPEARCGRPGQPCKRAANAIAAAFADPRCGRPGQPCKKDFIPEQEIDEIIARLVSEDPEVFEKVKNEAEAITKREAAPEPEARCGRPGQPCKREAAPEPEPEPEPEARCGRPGQPC